MARVPLGPFARHVSMNAPLTKNDSGFDIESGSFRDPESRIFYSDGAVYRALSPDGLADFEALKATKVFESTQADGRLVKTELVDEADSQPNLLVHERAGVLKHERIPFVSYPYEWPFSMLKDAAFCSSICSRRR